MTVTSCNCTKHGGLVCAVTIRSTNTTPITYTFDRRGRQKTIARAGMTAALTYNDADELLTESYSGGTLGGLSVTNGYDQFLRRTNLAALNSTTPLLQHSFTFDAASRLQTVTDNSGATPYSATYTYVANSPLVSQILFKENTTTRMTTTKQHDLLNRLTSISSVPSAASVLSFGYSYNDANQRTRVNLSDGSFWLYEYDKLGQLKSAKKYWPDWTPVAGQQFEYTFDDIGNRTQTKAGGDNNGANLRTGTYGANNLNQYTNRTIPGYIQALGTASSSATVSVWGTWWTSVQPVEAARKGDYFRGDLSWDNTLSPLWIDTSVIGLSQSGNQDIVSKSSGNLFIPQTPEGFTHDLDGNMTADGRWNYTWDAENRLIRMVSRTDVGPMQRIDFEYDWKGRRIREKVWNNTVGTGSPAFDITFLYDGWNLIAEINTSHTALRTYLWGLDLSGSSQGAGGIGGLLEVNDATNGVHFAGFDGNGNISALTRASDGTISARYEYGPFGEVLRATGPMAKANPLRFSTKYQDDISDLLYYGYRYYSPALGRWLSRDPLEEEAGPSLYSFVGNEHGR